MNCGLFIRLMHFTQIQRTRAKRILMTSYSWWRKHLRNARAITRAARRIQMSPVTVFRPGRVKLPWNWKKPENNSLLRKKREMMMMTIETNKPSVQLNSLHCTLFFLCVLFRSVWSAESLAFVESWHEQAKNKTDIQMRVQEINFSKACTGNQLKKNNKTKQNAKPCVKWNIRAFSYKFRFFFENRKKRNNNNKDLNTFFFLRSLIYW